MTYSQVIDIVGRPGELLTESEVADIHMAMYQWQNGIANMSVMIQDGRVVSKTQVGLP